MESRLDCFAVVRMMMDGGWSCELFGCERILLPGILIVMF